MKLSYEDLERISDTIRESEEMNRYNDYECGEDYDDMYAMSLEYEVM